jgi:hypothetical protein
LIIDNNNSKKCGIGHFPRGIGLGILWQLIDSGLMGVPGTLIYLYAF